MPASRQRSRHLSGAVTKPDKLFCSQEVHHSSEWGGGEWKGEGKRHNYVNKL